jgi:hypothetical protein
MSAGYLWRAAFEAPTAHRESLGGRANAVVLFGDRAPRYRTPATGTSETRRGTRGGHASPSQPVRRVPVRTLRSSAAREHVTRIEPSSSAAGARTPPQKPRPTATEKPAPTATEKPAPTATGATSPPRPPAPPAPSAPAPSPAASPPPATPSAAPPPAAATTSPPAPAPAPAAVTPNPASAPAAATSAGARPGWGNGDPNHTHTGPPGNRG